MQSWPVLRELVHFMVIQMRSVRSLLNLMNSFFYLYFLFVFINEVFLYLWRNILSIFRVGNCVIDVYVLGTIFSDYR